MSTTTSSRLSDAALNLAAGDYHVHPLRPRGKVPLTGHGFKDATRDEGQIRQWWEATPDANIGVACGQSGVVVLDIDSKAGADPEDVLEEFDIAGAPTIATGEAPEPCEKHPNSLAGVRGAQVYFRGILPSSTRLLIPAAEIKGVGGYTVGPGSIHPSGVEYLGALPAVAELPPAPGWLRELAQDSPEPRSLPPRDNSSDVLLAIPAEIYIPVLCGRGPGRDHKISCPFHDDGTPSLHVYPGDRGWACFGCGRGGSIYDFGSELWGIGTRGAEFVELRRRLAGELLRAAS
jgi:hypothetical protein